MLNYLSAPLGVSIEITGKCNLSCVYCFQGVQRQEVELSTKIIFRLIDELVDMQVFTLFLGGGEPLIQKDFFEIAAYASANGLEIGFSTNGTLIDLVLARKIADYKLGRGLQVSLDGSCPKTHDRLRGNGTFDRTLEGIRNLVKCGIRPSIAVTVTKSNILDISNIITLAEKENARHVHVMCLLPAGSAKKIFEQLDPDIEQWHMLQEELRNISKDVEGKLTIDWGNRCYDPPTHSFSEDDYSVVDKAFTGCPAGKIKAVIDCFGNVYGCDILKAREFIAGNVNEKSFKDIWDNSDVFSLWRQRTPDSIKGACSTCKWLFACVGGCPAMAIYHNNDLFSSDLSCPKTKSGN